MEDRKGDHIRLALQSQIVKAEIDGRFDYEPMLGSGQTGDWEPFTFLGKRLNYPLWISSMTGGAPEALTINQNLAKAAHKYGLGMGLGSCRILLENKKYLPDFDVRDILGDHLPLYANIGIAQLEKMQKNGEEDKLTGLVELLRADGLIIHVNPAQEFMQKEGDTLEVPPIESIQRFLEVFHRKLIIKEVGQGMGPRSINAILSLPVEAFETAAFGGTNFAQLEMNRRNPQQESAFKPLVHIGHPATEMLAHINARAESQEPIACKQIIFSGGIQNFLDGYYLLAASKLPAVYGQASGFLKHARVSFEALDHYIGEQIQGLHFAKAWLKLKTTR